MKILFATPEAAPYFRAGGLGDVGHALPDALAALGHDVVLLHPLYDGIEERLGPFEPEGELIVPWPSGPIRVRLLRHGRALLVEEPRVFGDQPPYGDPGGDANAIGLRFAFFCRVVARFADAWQADVVHLNDWATGLVPAYLLADGRSIPTVFAIHNIAYQGNFPAALFPHTGLPAELMRTENGLEFYGMLSFLKGGIALSDRLVTVSSTHAHEIQTPEYGAGLDGLLRFRSRVLHGILNGLDPRVWNPATDPALPASYTERSLDRKDVVRAAVLDELGLDGSGPFLVMVTRLAYQKGIDLVLASLGPLLDEGVTLAILGDGDAAYARALARAAAAAPRRIAVALRFDDGLARRLYAGGDFFLMPSLYEPGGIGQMIAQRYGTPPIARATGGLIDTVSDGVTGFLFEEPQVDALMAAVRHAEEVRGRRGWTTLRRRCMRLDRSWADVARKYVELYRFAIGHID